MKKIIIIILSVLFSVNLYSQWSRIDPPGYLGGYSNAQMLSKDLYFMSYAQSDYKSNIARSTNGGLNWDIIIRDSFHNTAEKIAYFYFLNSDTGLIFTIKKNAYLTTDGGKSVKLIDTFENKIKYPDGFSGKDQKLFFSGKIRNNHFFICTDSIMYRSTDLGESWKMVYHEKYLYLRFIQFVTPEIGFAFADTKIIKTVDGGLSWTKLCDIKGIWNMTFVSENVGFVNFDSKGIIRTKDGGKTWDTVNNGLPKFGIGNYLTRGMYFNDENNGWLNVGVYAGTQRTIYRTYNGGDHWYKLDFSDFGIPVSDMTGADTNTLILWPFGAYKGVFKTTNGGGPLSSIPESENFNSDNQISLYPNPAGNSFTIRINRGFSGLANAVIYSIQGERISELRLTESRSEIDASLFTRGIYFVKVMDKENVWVGKIAIEK